MHSSLICHELFCLINYSVQLHRSTANLLRNLLISGEDQESTVKCMRSSVRIIAEQDLVFRAACLIVL